MISSSSLLSNSHFWFHNEGSSTLEIVLIAMEFKIFQNYFLKMDVTELKVFFKEWMLLFFVKRYFILFFRILSKSRTVEKRDCSDISVWWIWRSLYSRTVDIFTDLWQVCSFGQSLLRFQIFTVCWTAMLQIWQRKL